VALTATPTDPLCHNGTGSIAASATGGTGTYTFQLDNGSPQSNGSFAGVATGQHTVVARDSNGCTDTKIVTINNPIAVALTATPTDPLCNNGTGSISASATGGTGSYTFQLDNGSFQSNGTFTGVASGQHTVVARDSNGCTDTKTVTLNNPPPVSVPVNSATYCPTANPNGVTLTASPSGGTPLYTYSWSPGGATTQSITVSPTSTTVYTVTVKDANGCTQIGSGTVTYQAPVVAAALGNVNLCTGVQAGFSTTITAGKAQSIGWTIQLGAQAQTLDNTVQGVVVSIDLNAGTSSVTIDTLNFNNAGPLTAGTYTITVNINGQCGTASQQGTLVLTDCNTFCSLTQGFYGSLKGKFLGTPGVTLVQNMLNGDNLVIGKSGNEVTITESDVTLPDGNPWLQRRMPAGGPDATIPNGNWTLANYPPSQLDKKGDKFRNNLLGQMIAFALNLRLPTNPLSEGFGINADQICSEAAVLVDGHFEPAPDSTCSCSGAIPQSVVDAVHNLKINEPSWAADTDPVVLLELANRVISGQTNNYNTYGLGLGDIHSAVGLLNEVFDECRAQCQK
jgi:hypothetical protein